MGIPLIAHATYQQRLEENQVFNREGKGQCSVAAALSQVPRKETRTPGVLSIRVLSNLDSSPSPGPGVRMWGQEPGEERLR